MSAIRICVVYFVSRSVLQ